MVTVHVPVPVHPPSDQPANVELPSGAAVSVTDVPLAKVAEQAESVSPQSMPLGAEVTTPLPVPLSATVSANPGTQNPPAQV